MNSQPKIQPQHLERQAYIYIRQSTMKQVEQNLESNDLQYHLVDRAQILGWSESRVVVIDDDLGKSAIRSSNRYGFQELVSAVGLVKVGIILVTDVSRLARNCSDWFQLLDLASLCGTLIADTSGVYEPRDYNDRLLLGLKGTFSEAQWYHMRMHLYAALLNKASRGDLMIRLPLGFEWTEDGKVVFVANQEAQNAIRLVFSQFERLGSARAVMLWLHDQDLQLPHCPLFGPDQGKIEWVKPSYQAIYRMLKHPAYAGAYTYGKKESTRLPGDGRKAKIRNLPREKWGVLIQNAFPGYITWEQYLENQKRLNENSANSNWSQRLGVPCNGQALLQGLVWCGKCGRKIKMRYSNHPAYVCEAVYDDYGEPRCQTFMAAHIDQAVVEIFLDAIQPIHLEAALAAMEQVEVQRKQLMQQWQQRLERARYEVDIARRRYDQVDPSNRLVAAELEHRWEEKLQQLQQLEQSWHEAQADTLKPLSDVDKNAIRQLALDLPALWNAPTTTLADKKRLIRCLIKSVTLDAFSKTGFSVITITWQTGTTSHIEVERPHSGFRTNKATVSMIAALAKNYPEDRIAEILNAQNILTATGKPWNRLRVETVQKQHHIISDCPYYTHTKGPRGDGLTAALEAAKLIGTSDSMLSWWFKRGWIIGHQVHPGAALWIRVSEDDILRWNGSATFQENFVPIAEAPHRLGLSLEKMQEEIRTGHLLTYRVRVKKLWRWFVQPPTSHAS